MNELTAPPAIAGNPEAVELVRAWIVNNGLQCTLNVGGFGESELATWGLILSDIARHVAGAHQQMNGSDATENLKIIAANFHTEMETPRAPIGPEE